MNSISNYFLNLPNEAPPEGLVLVLNALWHGNPSESRLQEGVMILHRTREWLTKTRSFADLIGVGVHTVIVSLSGLELRDTIPMQTN